MKQQMVVWSPIPQTFCTQRKRHKINNATFAVANEPGSKHHKRGATKGLPPGPRHRCGHCLHRIRRTGHSGGSTPLSRALGAPRGSDNGEHAEKELQWQKSHLPNNEMVIHLTTVLMSQKFISFQESKSKCIKHVRLYKVMLLGGSE